MIINSIDGAIDFVKSEISIESIVSKYLKLTKSSANSFKGLCPFHSEKTPSFYVNSDKKIYKCFGCGESGDSIKFIQEVEKINFIDSIKKILSLSNVSLELSDKNQTSALKEKEKKEKIYNIYKDAVIAYNDNLMNEKVAINYLKNRKIDKEMIGVFNLGFADLNKSLYLNLKKKYTDEDIIESGLCSKSQNGIMRDFFYNRIMFPIKDINGNFVGFGGRITNEDSKYPKYINSKETSVFKKSKILFNCDMLRVIAKSDIPLIVEGYCDVISVYKTGYKYAFAPLGTSLTIDQISLIFRYSDKIAICMDSDDAGRNATIRSCRLIFSEMKESSKIYIVDLSKYKVKDIDEYLNKDGNCNLKTIKTLISGSQSLDDFIFKYYTNGFKIENLSDKIRIEKELLEFSDLNKDIVVSNNYKMFFRKKINELFYGKSKKKQEYFIDNSKIYDSNLDSELNILAFMILFFDEMSENFFFFDENFKFLNENSNSLMELIINCGNSSEIIRIIPENLSKKVKQLSFFFDKKMPNKEILELYMTKLILINKLERNKLEQNFNSREEFIMKNKIFEINEKINSSENYE